MPERVLQVPLDHPRDARRERGGEEDRLPLGRRFREDRLQVVGESHVEHLVGFVEREDRDAAQVDASCGGCDRPPGPGVATTMSTPRSSIRCCWPNECPP